MSRTSPVVQQREQREEDYDYFIEKSVSHQVLTKEGDIIHDFQPKIQVSISYFPCPAFNCKTQFTLEKTLTSHLFKSHKWTEEETNTYMKNPRSFTKMREYPWMNIFYAHIVVREPSAKPDPVEVDLTISLQKGTQSPSPRQREKYDEEVKAWREQWTQKSLNLEVTKLPLCLDGTYFDKGGKKWWHWKPEIYEEAFKEWRPAERNECEQWDQVKKPKRVLYLLNLIPEA